MNKLANRLHEAFKALNENALIHPAVSISLIFTAIAAFITFLDASDHEPGQIFEAGLTMVPWAIMLALVMDKYVGNYNFKPSLISLVTIALGMFFPVKLTEWIGEPSFNIIYFIVLPLVMVTYRRRVSDGSFIREVIWNVFSLGVAMLVALLFAGLFAGIIGSCEILFDMSSSLENKLFSFIGAIAIALGGFIFISVGERENYKQINTLVQPVSNYLIAPALLIYTIVLYAYILKIVIEQTMPDGGVAIMCIIWLLAALYVAASQLTFEKQPYTWFSRIYGFIAIPIVVMLWVAAFRRVNDYGITPSRYYLLLSALIVTACVVTALIRRKNLYYMIAVSAAAIYVGSVIVPWVNYRAVTGYSQVRIIRTEADALGKLHNDGTVDNYGYYLDEAHGRKIRSAVSVLSKVHPASLEILGLSDGIDIVTRKKEPLYVNTMMRDKSFVTDNYSKIWFEPETFCEDGVIKIDIPGEREIEIRCDEFINNLLEKCGIDSHSPTESQFEPYKNELSTYEGEGYMLILENIFMYTSDGEIDTSWVSIGVKAVFLD